jgi:hypothetical protein
VRAGTARTLDHFGRYGQVFGLPSRGIIGKMRSLMENPGNAIHWEVVFSEDRILGTILIPDQFGQTE